LANGTHFVEDGLDLPVGGDSLFEEVGLLRRERQSDGFRFDLCCPPPVAWVIGCEVAPIFRPLAG
jgi:hypothetical protein